MHTILLSVPDRSQYFSALPSQQPAKNPTPPHASIGAWQVPLMHEEPAEHEPQEPSQPLSPHVLPVQVGTHPHWPDAPQAVPEAQVPHEPPQPSPPHVLPAQSGWQVDGQALGKVPAGSEPEKPQS